MPETINVGKNVKKDCADLEELQFYKTLCLVFLLLIVVVTFALILVFRMMQSQVNRLCQIHDFGLT